MTDETVMGEGTVPPAQSTKVDPESLVLRARPLRAIRFKRSVVIGLAGSASIGLVTTAWVALTPPSFRPSPAIDQRETMLKAPIDTLSSLPADYGDAPKLGPPLPGDLGRPILERQRQMVGEGPQPIGTGEVQAAASAHERRLAQIRAARESPLLVPTGQNGPVGQAPSQSLPTSPSAPDIKDQLALDPEKDPNAQQRKLDFIAQDNERTSVNPHRLVAAPSPYTLSAGSVIAASLITGLRSDLPGLVTAQITEHVFDSATGRILLIPQGARLVGSYDSVVAFGQKRALIVWQRLVLPDGSSLKIDNVPATDARGYAGLADKVDFHTWSLLKGAALSTLLGIGANLTFRGESDLVQAIREATQQNASRAGDQLTSRNLQIQPTITIRPGTPVRLVVHRDLILAPWRG